jgi:hypothetical protein
MAYDAKGLKLISVGGAIGSGAGSVKNVYHYATNDTDTVVEGNGYFDGVAGDPLNAGDIIIASLDIDGTAEVKMYVVAVGGGDVDITPMKIA